MLFRSLAFWQNQQKAGMSLGDIANYFAQSPEAVKQYGAEGSKNLSQLLGGAIAPNSTTQPYKTLYTTGGAPIVNPDGSIASFPEVELPSATQQSGQQGLYSESDIAKAGQGAGPNPGLLIWAAQSGNPMMAILAQQQAEESQRAATARADQMRAHNAAIMAKPRTPMGYFMNLDYSTMSPSGLFGFNVVSPYYAQTYPTANAALDPTGQAWRSHGGKVNDRKGFDFGGSTYSHEAGQLPSMMTGPGSQTSPSSFGTGYNPGAFNQQRSEGGRMGYAGGGRSGDFYNSV